MQNLRRTLAILGLVGTTSMAIAAVDDHSWCKPHSENLVFTLAVGQAVSCKTPASISFDLSYPASSEDIGQYNNKSLADYSEIKTLYFKHLGNHGEAYVDLLTSKLSHREIIISGVYISATNDSFGAWTDDQGCHGTYKNQLTAK